MILPTLTHIIIQGFCVVTLILTLMFWPQFAALWAIGYGLLWCVLLLDALTLIGTPKRLHASPVLAERWSLGEEAFLDCVLSNTSGWRPAFGRVVLSTDGAFHHAPIVAWRAPAGTQTVVRVPLSTWRRGDASVETAELRVLSALHLFERRRRLIRTPLHSQIYANLRAVQRAAARSSTLQSYLQGLRVQRRIGDGQAFEALRQFQPGHDTRAIDWSVSARMRALHVREFREERNHNLVLAFDTGRLMTRDLDGLSRLDHALNASLHLAYVALRLADRVGLLGFDEDIRRWSAPRPDIEALGHLIDEAQHLPYTLNVSDFRRATLHLNRKLRRRSIVFLFTEFDALTLDQGLLEALAPLHRKHQLTVVTMSPYVQQRTLAVLPLDAVDTALAEATLQKQRNAALHTLRARGIHVIDTPPDRLATALLTRYQEQKQRGLV